LAKARILARALRPCFTPASFAAEQPGAGAVDDARRIAGVMDVVDALDFLDATDRHRIEARHLAHRTNDGCNGPSDCIVVVGLMCSSWPEW